MTPQSSITIIAAIVPGKVEALRDLLHSMNQVGGIADENNLVVPFSRFTRLHYARFVILEDNTAEDITAFGRIPGSWEPRLAFLCDCDGLADSFLAELAVIAEPGLLTVFSHCVGFEENQKPLLRWLNEHRVKSAANYINTLGRTVSEVQENIVLHNILSKKLVDIQTVEPDLQLSEIRKQLLDHLAIEKHEGRLTLTRAGRTPLLWSLCNLLHKLGVPLVLLLLSPLILMLLPFYLVRLRQLEKSDPEIFKRPELDHVGKLAEFEDYDVTNQFSAFGQLKPQWFRQQSARFFLWLLNYAARHVYNRGFLTRVHSIHFARWVFLDNFRYMLFASNYDGSEESYMDDFVNKVAWGLNLVFSNGVGYPTTNWLIKQGAKREEIYKAFLRRRQLPTECWYKAYPGKTAFDLQRNTKIREGVENRPKTDSELRAWLGLIQAGGKF